MVNVVNNSLGKSNVVYNVGNDSVADVGGFTNGLEEMAGQVGLIDTAHQLNQEGREEDQEYRDQTYEQYPQPPANDFGVDPNQMYEGNDYNAQMPQDQEFETEDYQETSPQPSSTPRKNNKKKKDGNKRFDTMAVNLAQRIKERDEALEKALYLEQELIREREARLGITNKAYDREIDQLTDLMINARNTQDYDTEKKASKAISALQAAQLQNEEKQRIFQEHLIERERASQQTENINPVVRELFDKRELDRLEAQNASGLLSWLERNPACNPNSPDFDEEYAAEVAKIKKGFTKTYIRSGESNLIGEDEYYDELDQLLDHQFGRIGKNKMSNNNQMMPPNYPYQDPYAPRQQMAQGQHIQQPQQQYRGAPMPNYPQQPPQGYYQQPQYPQAPMQQHPYGPQMNNPRMYTVPIGNNPPVSRVNRAGYNNQYGAQQRLPQLDAVHREIAMKIPYEDANGNAITDPNQRLRLYQESLANEPGSGGNYGY